MIDFGCFERAACTREEKAETAILINLWVSLCEKSRRDGILALGEDRDALGDSWTGELLALAIDGLEVEDIRAMGETAIAASGLSGLELLNAMVALAACLSLRAGDRTQTMAMKLTPFLGRDGDLVSAEDLLAPGRATPGGEAASAGERKLDMGGIAEDIRARLKLSARQVESLRARAEAGKAFESLEPDVIAIALLYMDEKTRVRVLSSLPSGLQAAVIRSVCGLDAAPADFCLEAARESLEGLIEGIEQNYAPAGGIGSAVSLLASMTEKASTAALAALSGEAPELSASLRDRMFTFENLAALDDRSIQKIIASAPPRSLASALKGAAPAVRDTFFKNMSANAAEILKEDMEYMGPVRIGQVRAAQAELRAVALELEKKGEIIIIRGAPDEELVR